MEYRQVAYLNHVLEDDLGQLKRILRPKGRSRTGRLRTGRSKVKTRYSPTGSRTRMW